MPNGDTPASAGAACAAPATAATPATAADAATSIIVPALGASHRAARAPVAASQDACDANAPSAQVPERADLVADGVGVGLEVLDGERDRDRVAAAAVEQVDLAILELGDVLGPEPVV